MKVKWKLFVVLILLFGPLRGQYTPVDSIQIPPSKNFNYKPWVIPTILIAYGAIGLENDNLKLLNEEIREEVTENIDRKTTIDDFSQFAPALSVYGLNAMGIEGKNRFVDRSVILGTAYIIMGASTIGLKKLTKVERPDRSSFDSWPSGHTATAFMGAEFLMQEYKDVSIWYGIAGYVVATGTGIFRMYNNRHWLTDVAAGAGIGMLSTKIAYWVNPFIQEKIFGKKRKDSLSTASILPFYNEQGTGLGVSISF